MAQTESSAIPLQRTDDASPSVAEFAPRDVCRAFRLGWHIADHYRELAAPAKPRDDDTAPVSAGLPLAGQLDQRDLFRAGLAQVRVDFNALQIERRVGSCGLEVPDLRNLLDEGQFQTVGPEKAAALLCHLHVDLLTTLMAVEPALGKAYDLGMSLANFCAPTKPPDAPFHPEPHELLRLHDLVRELTSALPAHAGHAVSTSMAHWHAYLSQDLHRAFVPRSAAFEKRVLLVRQGHQWRALLGEEKNPEDDLSASEFVQAGLASLNRGQRELRRVVGAIWPLLLVLVAAAALVLAVTVKAASGTAESTTALTTVAATLGAGWRALKAPMGRAFSGIENRLRDAEIDTAIADSITMTPPDASSRKVHSAARKVARVQRPEPSSPGQRHKGRALDR